MRDDCRSDCSSGSMDSMRRLSGTILTVQGIGIGRVSVGNDGSRSVFTRLKLSGKLPAIRGSPLEIHVRARRGSFGAFEADLHSTSLHNYGVKIKLQDQPFEIRALLLEAPHETITPEGLRRRTWPA